MKTVRIKLELNAPGFVRTAGEDELTKLLGKMVPSELQKRVGRLRTAVNNTNSLLKEVFGASINHPQGGLASLDGTGKMPSLENVLKLAIEFRKESDSIQSEIDRLVQSGEFQARIDSIEGLDRRRITPPSVRFEPIVSLNEEDRIEAGKIFDKVGVYPTVRRLVVDRDEKLISVLGNLAKKMNSFHEGLLQKTLEGKKITKDELLKANSRFASGLQDEIPKIIATMGGASDATAQIVNVINQIYEGGKTMSSLLESIKLSDGVTPVTEAVDINGLLRVKIEDVEKSLDSEIVDL